ncbi:unnamed protein product [Pedinophyceae sp. YPF-701]|nr:unnamed protein product [Pedinophyceae sp. YPF-701]
MGGRGGGRRVPPSMLASGAARDVRDPLADSNQPDQGDDEVDMEQLRTAREKAEWARRRAAEDEAAQERLGFPTLSGEEERLGWLMNFSTSTVDDAEAGVTLSSVTCFFVCEDGSMFRAKVPFAPYFYLHVRDGHEPDVEAFLRRRFEGVIKDCEVVEREDLDLKNHLAGVKRRLLKVSFHNVQGLMDVKKAVQRSVQRGRADGGAAAGGGGAYNALVARQQAALAAGQAAMEWRGEAVAGGDGGERLRVQDALDAVVELREYDVPYHTRWSIDSDVRCGLWYAVRVEQGVPVLRRRADMVRWAEPRIVAWDIETTKLPLQFPNAEVDQVFMISYMIDRQGYLIVNRDIVTDDIADFEYSPKPEFPGPFRIFNEANEEATLRRFFTHMRTAQPAVYVTYNGDFFDWPFVERRAKMYKMDVRAELGFKTNDRTGECLSRFAVHMDCLHWVNRDSYLPQGSRGLKAVTKAKLGYDPVEVNPEDMLRFAAEQPQTMASYSVSDAVSTYYLYMTYIHPFIFSLATIIPLPPDEVLRKGSGTLCEMLLMVQAYQARVVCPNKHVQEVERFHKGHPLEAETYIGGHVEALEAGVYRADIPTKFRCDPAGYQTLLDNLDRDLAYAVEHEGGMRVEDVENLGEVAGEIRRRLEDLRDRPVREEKPLIYHLDVGAMYPNIILTNRLQPSATVTEEDCAACVYNRPGKTCLREMEWVWRGDYYMSNRHEYNQIKAQLASERHALPDGKMCDWDDLDAGEQTRRLKDRLKKYTQRAYKRVLDKPETERRVAGICQRENAFYIDTVRAFRDRRYEYKKLKKVWTGKLEEARRAGEPARAQEAADMCVLYESLQLAHKCILNSFYGYVMRKGARWYSMEMAGVVTYTGAQIIQNANRLITQVGKPLELDTDGIWCALPGSFPEDFKLRGAGGKSFKMSYPCSMLNVQVAEYNTNDQYGVLDPATGRYSTRREMSIEFEVDGPYLAMVLPASQQEGKLIKKRYAVFNFDKSLAELKGFEIKRRGELKLVKAFQGEVFSKFLEGGTIAEVYAAVGAVADRWLDMLDTHGVDLGDEELLEYISESCTMSKSLEEYEGRKSCAVTTATRLAEFLGDSRIKDKGLKTNYVVSRFPEGRPTSERAVPVIIFSAQQVKPHLARHFLAKWCRGAALSGDHDQDPDPRDIVDWAYYKERLGNAVQKIITIPAAMQGVSNPVPRVAHPEWLQRRVRAMSDKSHQMKLDGFMAAMRAAPQQVPCGDADADGDGEAESDGDEPQVVADIEDMGSAMGAARKLLQSVGGRKTKRKGDGGDSPSPGDENGPDADAAAPKTPELVPADRDEDYGSWLRAQKAVWRSRRAELARKRQRQAAEAAALARAGPKGTAGNFFRQQQQQASTSTWQVLQVAETRAPGEFRLWVLVNGQMYAVPLRMDRTFYVDSSLQQEDIAIHESELMKRAKPANVRLPWGRTPHNVWRVDLPEFEFRQGASTLALELAAPHVHGVYESRMPLQFRAAMDLGCIAAVAPHATDRPLNAVFEIGDLLVQSSAGALGKYLSDRTALKSVFVYHSYLEGRMAQAGRGIIVVVLPGVARGVCAVINPARRGAQQEVAPGAMEKEWRDLARQLNCDKDAHPDAPPPVPEKLKFEVVYTRDFPSAAKHANQAIREYRERAKGPAMAVCQGPRTTLALQRDIPALQELPCVHRPAVADDGRALREALGWQWQVARGALARVAQGALWFEESVQAARFANLPLGNLGGDWVLHTVDVLLARALHADQRLVWAADASLPDVGATDAGPVSLLEGRWQPPEINNPGAYREVCVELSVWHLCVATMDAAEQLEAMEGALSSIGGEGGCGGEFGVLRSVILTWLQQATVRHDVCADAMLKHLYRWVCSGAARLHDPTLQRALQDLMARLFLHLVAEVTRLGARVIFAELGRVVIATGKRTIEAARDHVAFLLSAVSRNEMFRLLQLEPGAYYHAVLWRDQHNFTGLKSTADEPRAPSDVVEMEDSAGGSPGAAGGLAADMSLAGIELVSEWALADYLPEVIRQDLHVLLAEVVYRPWEHARRTAPADGGDESQEGAGDAAAELDKPGRDETAEVLLEHFKTALVPSLIDKVRDIDRHVVLGDKDPAHRFPERAGSHLTAQELGTPALAFVRTACEALALDAALRDEAAILARQLLRVLHVREFSAEAEFRDPCRSWVLRDVVCHACNDCRDIDLCRDHEVEEGVWRCRMAACRRPYDLEAIEAALCAHLDMLGVQYQSQDVRCAKCGRVKRERLTAHCDCGGALENDVPLERVREELRIFVRVADRQGFELLGEQARWLLQEVEAEEEPEELFADSDDE